MPNYDALRDYLKQQTQIEFVLSFAQIEQIIEDDLPRAAQRASWWDTTRAEKERMPQREACIEAGYVATRLGDKEGVRFRRADAKRPRFK
ncbi:DUF7662 domain-containing protein [Nitrobacter sp. TKz-YC02]|uniref:DUF7662 domain-containing protein n=1 Tax=Nitrobacter sp. TKz-YC02 TaxID=3398704 RepID=UPI003CF41CBA